METIAGIPHFSSEKECIDYIHDNPNPTLPTVDKVNDWIVLADHLGDLRRTKHPLQWELEQISNGRLYELICQKNDFIFLEDIKGTTYRVNATHIPEDWTSNIKVSNIATKKQCLSGDFKIAKIYLTMEVKNDKSTYW
jgi:hypothetical protein